MKNYIKLSESQKKTAAAACFAMYAKRHPQLFRNLHNAFNFDFCRPFYAVRINNPVTVNQINTAFNPIDYKVIILLDAAPMFNEFRVAEILNGCARVDFRAGLFSYPSHLGCYWRKLDFESDRKSNKDKIIIAQKNEYLTEKNAAPVNPSERFFNPVPRFCHYGFKNSSDTFVYISEVTGTTATGKKYTAHNNNRELTQMGEIIDKSGYFIGERRAELKRRADAIRAERKKKEVDAANFDEALAEIKIVLNLYKGEINRLVNAAAAYEDYKTIAEKTNTLKWIIWDIERFKNRIIKSDFISLEQAENDYNSIINKLNA